jgi:hypothetical protein
MRLPLLLATLVAGARGRTAGRIGEAGLSPASRR